jgi:flagellar motor protein MotB
MRGKGDRKGGAKVEIHVHRDEVIAGGSHSGSWKVAYADFVTAMMAFFLLMWLLNATTEDQRKGLADYFSPNSVLSHNSSGTGQPFGGRTAFAEGAMVSDRGAAQVMEGSRPVVDQVDEDESDVLAQPRPHRDDIKSMQADRNGQPAATANGKKPAARDQPAATRPLRGRLRTGDAGRAVGRCASGADQRRTSRRAGAAGKAGLRAGGTANPRGRAGRCGTGGAGAAARDRHDARRPAHPDPR